MGSTLGRPEAPPTTLLTLPDEMLEEVLLRLPAAADLARASMARGPTPPSAASSRITASSAVSRARHPPPLLGTVSPRSCRDRPPLRLAQPTHPSAAAASAFSGFDAAGFSCAFLPSAERWRGRDLRDGRVLLSGIPEGSRFSCLVLVRDLAVCDPIYRRYMLLPPIPQDLAALAQPRDTLSFEPFLAPPAPGDEGDMSFGVICLAQCTTKLVLLIFSSGAGQWLAVTFDNWITLITGSDVNPAPGNDPVPYRWPRKRYYAHGYFCWAFYPGCKLVMLDAHTMDFSAVDLPPGTNNTQVAILEAGNGRIGMFINEYMTPELRYIVLQYEGVGANHWLSEAIFSLPVNYHYIFLGVAGGYLLLHEIPEHKYSFPLAEKEDSAVLSLNLKTLQLELFYSSKFGIMEPYLFVGFPPSLSPPTL